MTPLPPGESGPRRPYGEPLDTAAANAEAARMAAELGVAGRPAGTPSSVSSGRWRLPRPIPNSTRYQRYESNDSIGSYLPPSVDEPEEVYEFDQHGQRAPYKEGPFILSRDQTGRVVKKRWCKFLGRIV